MSNQPARWRPNALERAHSQALEALDHRTELVEEEVAGIARIEGRAHFEKMKAGLIRQEAMRLDPGGADEYHMISVAGTVAMVNVISRYSRGR